MHSTSPVRRWLESSTGQWVASVGATILALIVMWAAPPIAGIVVAALAGAVVAYTGLLGVIQVFHPDEEGKNDGSSGGGAG